MHNSNHKIPYAGYISSIIAQSIITVYILWDKNIMGQTDIAEIYKILCDAFFVPGILFTCLGVIIEVSNSGFFNIFSYSMRLFFDSFTKSRTFRSEYETYFDYTVMKTNKEKVTTSYILFTGLLFIGIGVIFNLLFYKVYVDI